MSNMRGGGGDDGFGRGGRGGGGDDEEAMRAFREQQFEQQVQQQQAFQQPQQPQGFGQPGFAQPNMQPNMQGRGAFRPIGGDGEWRGTRAMCFWRGRLWASHSNGKVFGIDPQSGQWQQVGTNSGWNTRLMLASADMLLLIEQSGTAWALDPMRGGHLQVGKDGEWANIDAADWTDQHIYCHSTQGTLWKFTLPGSWQQIGNNNGWKSRLVFAGHGLVTVEQDHSVFRVDPTNGAFQKIGQTQHSIRAGTATRGHVYACFDDGGLYDLNIDNGQWSQIGNAKTWASQLVVAAGDGIITLEERGTFFAVSV